MARRQKQFIGLPIERVQQSLWPALLLLLPLVVGAEFELLRRRRVVVVARVQTCPTQFSLDLLVFVYLILCVCVCVSFS